jgi:uncharacterized RDD family membrane protein YckC
MASDAGYGAVRGKADLGKRFAAYVIDGLVAIVPALVASLVFAIAGLRDAGWGLGLLASAAYILVRDGLNYDFADGRSIGKKIMKLRAERNDGAAVTIETSIRRNWTLAAPYVMYGLSALFGGLNVFVLSGLFWFVSWAAFLLAIAEAVLVLTDKEGRRLGDKMADTYVYEAGA